MYYYVLSISISLLKQLLEFIIIILWLYPFYRLGCCFYEQRNRIIRGTNQISSAGGDDDNGVIYYDYTKWQYLFKILHWYIPFHHIYHRWIYRVTSSKVRPYKRLIRPIIHPHINLNNIHASIHPYSHPLLFAHSSNS